jgi:Zn-finger nucleic acid-binding protein
MNCPKCENEMRSYERNGVTVDQCTGCRGIFLDRGELERLIDAESSFYEREAERPPEREERHDRHERDDRHGGKPKKSKKKSFLENLMELGGE